jgi:hypothetical protein
MNAAAELVLYIHTYMYTAPNNNLLSLSHRESPRLAWLTVFVAEAGVCCGAAHGNVFLPVADRVVVGLAAIGVCDGVKVASLVRPKCLILPVETQIALAGEALVRPRQHVLRRQLLPLAGDCRF